ncbi:MAG: PQQ-dependent sugar dehydrogenase [Candidatus Babeliales bacterium]
MIATPAAQSSALEVLPLEKIKLPEGFHIKVFADNLPGSRFITRGEQGTIFVGSKGGYGKVYALVPSKDGQSIARKITLLTGLDEPNGVTFHNGALYVAEIGRILRYDNIEANLDKAPAPIVITDKLPNMRWHGYKIIDVGPDNLLYVAIGMPCNTCNYRDTKPLLGTISRMKLDGSDIQPYAIGIRNSMGFTWHPDTKELWFTDNGQDLLGDDLPPDEINYAPKAGMDFGFPYVYGNNIIAPDYVTQKIDTTRFAPPAWNLQAHVAPLGIAFYTGTQFPKAYQKQIFVAFHGSWNRSKKVGYEVVMLTLAGNKITKMEPFATGWLQGEAFWGRPVDILTQPDGSLLISDDYNGAIYQVTYDMPAKK